MSVDATIDKVILPLLGQTFSLVLRDYWPAISHHFQAGHVKAELDGIVTVAVKKFRSAIKLSQADQRILDGVIGNQEFLSVVYRCVLGPNPDQYELLRLINREMDPPLLSEEDFQIAWTSAEEEIQFFLAGHETIRKLKDLIQNVRGKTTRVARINEYFDLLEQYCDQFPPVLAHKDPQQTSQWIQDAVKIKVPCRRGSDRGTADVSLYDLLNPDSENLDWAGNSWVIEGGAGSGKTVLLKLLAKQLIARNRACTTLETMRAVPLFIHHKQELCDRPWLDALSCLKEEDTDKYEEAFAALKELPGGLCVLVDSFDETPTDLMDPAKRRFNLLKRQALAQGALIIASRPLYSKWEGHQTCKVQDLTLAAKTTFLESWIEDSSLKEKMLQELADGEKLSFLTTTPLLLALYAKAKLNAVQLSGDSKADLMRDYVRALLVSQHHPECKAIPAPRRSEIRHILRHLAFVWQKASSGSTPEPDDRVDTLLKETGLFPEGSDLHERLMHFKQDAVRLGFLFRQYNDSDLSYKWIHRQVQEFLAAEYLNKQPTIEHILPQLPLKQRDDREKWSKVLAFYCSLVGENALERMWDIAGCAEDLEADIIEALDGVPFGKRLDALTKPENWSIRRIETLLLDAIRQGRQNEVEEWAWKKAHDASDLMRLGFMFHVLKTVSAAFDATTFFAKIEIPQTDLPELQLINIPSVRLEYDLVGEESFQNQSETISAFAMCATPVTNAQFAVLEGLLEKKCKLPPSREANDLPVVDVSWYAAALFSAWLGMSLPTEKQWFTACALGRRSLPDNAEPDFGIWHLGNAKRQVQPVASLGADGLGLHDMLGNVWEWTSDWFDPDKDGLDDSEDPASHNKRKSKTAMGGCYTLEPQLCQPNFIAYGPPRKGLDCLGFRPVAPEANPMAQSTLDTVTYRNTSMRGFYVWRDYEATFNSSYGRAYGILRDTVNELITRWDFSDQKPIIILDVGCGDGWMYDHLNRELAGKVDPGQVTYVGLDVNQPGLDRLAEKRTALISLRTVCLGAEAFLDHDSVYAALRKSMDHQDPHWMICTATGHQIQKSVRLVKHPNDEESRKVYRIYNQMAEMLRINGFLLIGDYEYAETYSHQKIEESLFWIRSRTGQDPTSSGGFIPEAYLRDKTPRGREWLLNLVKHQKVQANEFIHLDYYAFLWRKEKR